ncbi:hypothetical protein FA95DRAFT_671979 [Auriscalpium vulgare]|uniref:Uncharacterized protein n=1 Tax=Auriscalpium vulgare TaxID=40419 RepID=A0ACB8RDI4_9AGAM|nr:hypothetical protein FA95DRAFT_671979 [Auriscalpium vulgare]
MRYSHIARSLQRYSDVPFVFLAILPGVNGSNVVLGPHDAAALQHSRGHEGSSQASPVADNDDGIAQGQQPLDVPADVSALSVAPLVTTTKLALTTSAETIPSATSQEAFTISSSAAMSTTISSLLSSATASPSSNSLFSPNSPTASTQTSSATTSATTSAPTSAPTTPITISAKSPHGVSFYAGLALAGIAALAVILTLFMWWFRIRRRTRRRPWETHWWRRPDDDSGEPSTAETQRNWWQPLDEPSAGEPVLGNTMFDPPTPEDPFRDPVMASHAGAVDTANPARHDSPCPALKVIPVEFQVSDATVPDITQDLGTLGLTNAVTGDILTSGDETSRPTTALSANTDVGTLRDEDGKPRYLSLDGGGLTVPWTPMHHPAGSKWKTRLAAARPSNTADEPKETWTDSLKTNFTNAFAALTFNAPTHPPLPAPPPTPYGAGVGPILPLYGQGTADTAPPKESSVGSQLKDDPPAVGSTAHARTRMLPLPPGRPDSDDAGQNAQLGRPPPLAPESSVSLSSDSQEHGQPSLPPPPLPSPYHRVTWRAAVRRPISGRRPPRPRGTRSKPKRPSTTHRHTSSAASDVSVGSDMTRSSSVATRWGNLNAKEEAARRALRERRKKAGTLYTTQRTLVMC